MTDKDAVRERERTISAGLRRMIPHIRALRNSDLGANKLELVNLVSNAAAGLEHADRIVATVRASALEEAAKIVRDCREPWNGENPEVYLPVREALDYAAECILAHSRNLAAIRATPEREGP